LKQSLQVSLDVSSLQSAQLRVDRPLPPHWPTQTTLRQFCTKYLDFAAVPRRSFFEFLAYFTTNPDETEKLREFASKEGQEDLYDYANRPRRTIYEVLTEFKSAAIPVDYAADLFPELRPRSFSIASSSRANLRQIDLLVAIVSYKTKLYHPRRGVCTTWLAAQQPGTFEVVESVG
jgi:sulfite reductase alpha subunit-like flavoprotein